MRTRYAFAAVAIALLVVSGPGLAVARQLEESAKDAAVEKSVSIMHAAFVGAYKLLVGEEPTVASGASEDGDAGAATSETNAVKAQSLARLHKAWERGEDAGDLLSANDRDIADLTNVIVKPHRRLHQIPIAPIAG